MNSNKLIYPTLLVSAVAVMTSYLQLPLPGVTAAALVFLLLLLQLAASRRVPNAPAVPPEFQAKLASLENLNSRQLKQIIDYQTQLESLSKESEALEAQNEGLKSQNASYDARVVKLQNAMDQSQGGDEQAVIQFVRNLQARGRFLDFVMADIHSLPDTQVGAVSRVVHQGLRDLMDDYFAVKPIAAEAEGALIPIPKDDLGHSYSLVQSRGDSIPSNGRLLHRGWRAGRMRLPQSQKHEGASGRLVLAHAEVDVSESPL